MTLSPLVLTAPPYQHKWHSEFDLQAAIVGNGTVYGVTPAQKLIAIDATTGALKWQAASTYLPGKIGRQGTRLFAYRLEEGLGYVDDLSTHASERLAISSRITASTNISMPVADGRMVYGAVNSGLFAVHQEQGLQYGAVLGEVHPYSVHLLGPGQLLVIDGTGRPYRYEVTPENFKLIWLGADHGVDGGQAEREFAVLDNRVIISVGADLVAYNLSTGFVDWKLSNVPATTLAADRGVIYAGFVGASVTALRATDGAAVWHRQYLSNLAILRDSRIAVAGDYLFFGTKSNNPDHALLMALDVRDGSFAWLSRSASGEWSAGLPIIDGNRIVCYGGSGVGAYEPMASPPHVSRDAIEVAPPIVRGPQAGFEPGKLGLTLDTTATVSAAVYREVTGVGPLILNQVSLPPGQSDRTWNTKAPDGFTDTNQFGFMIVDIAETPSTRYSQTILLPVNTFPDISHHWAQQHIELMVYHKYISGYADKTFKPNNLVTKAESCSIVAKTLRSEAPSPGFQTKFTDIATHWGRNYIMALEEKGIVSGVAEPDGTFTFRPDQNMTRAEEARILVRAFKIPAAPSNFETRFIDIRGHWAESDIKALEAAGFVTGIREPNGTFTYRPNQNLTRAELSTIVSRILHLTR